MTKQYTTDELRKLIPRSKWAPNYGIVDDFLEYVDTLAAADSPKPGDQPQNTADV